MKLHPINYNHSGRLWCGIATLAAITGNSTEHCRQVFREVLTDRTSVTGKKRVLKGIFDVEFLECCRRYCIDIQAIVIPTILHNYSAIEISLSRFFHCYKLPSGSVGAAIIPGHILAFDNQRIIDSSYSAGIPIWQYPRLDEPVRKVWALNNSALDNL